MTRRRVAAQLGLFSQRVAGTYWLVETVGVTVNIQLMCFGSYEGHHETWRDWATSNNHETWIAKSAFEGVWALFGSFKVVSTF